MPHTTPGARVRDRTGRPLGLDGFNPSALRQCRTTKNEKHFAACCLSRIVMRSRAAGSGRSGRRSCRRRRRQGNHAGRPRGRQPSPSPAEKSATLPQSTLLIEYIANSIKLDVRTIFFRTSAKLALGKCSRKFSVQTSCVRI